jgi:hypothetical protein
MQRAVLVMAHAFAPDDQRLVRVPRAAWRHSKTTDMVA